MTAGALTASGRIVIVTPGQLGSNPRVVKEADSLHAAGCDVEVIATRVADFVESRDRAVMAAAPWRLERLAFDDRRLWHLERAVQEAAGRLRHLWPSGRLDALAHSPMARRLLRVTATRRADLFIAHYPAALSAAARAAALCGTQYAFDAEDFHPGDLPDLPQHRQARALISAIERRYLPGAAYVTAAAPGIADAYAATYGIPRPTVVLNAFERGRGAAAPTPCGTVPGPSVYWVSQTVGADRGLECAVEAIARAATRPHLYLRGTPQKGYETRLRHLAETLGCADRLHLLPPEAPSEMERLAAVHDLGLVGETGTTPNRRIALTNKQFTYLLAGVPAVMSDIPAHTAFAAEAEGAAFLYRTEDPASLAAVLDDLLSDPERLARARARAHHLGQTRFNWEAEAPKLLGCVERALDPSVSKGEKR